MSEESEMIEPDGNSPESESNGHPIHWKILAGLLVGIVLGLTANLLGSRPATDGRPDPLDVDGNRVDDRVDWVAQNVADPIGKVFLRLVLMVVVPLVVSALALGVYGIGDVRHLGRIGARTLFFTAVFSVSAVVIGVSLVALIRPGEALTVEQRDNLKQKYSGGATVALERAKQAKPMRDVLLDMIPENPLQEMVGAVDGSSKGNGMLSVMVFALMIGIAMTFVPEKTRVLAKVLEGIFEVTMVIIRFAMTIAPYAVACLVFALTARLGLDILKTLFWFVVTVLVGLLIQMVIVYSIMVRTFGGMRPVDFFRGASEAILTAFGTSSSNATLPTAMRVAETELKLPSRISNFVLTIGATGNQNGTALFEGVVVLFLAQVFGVELSLTSQIMVVLMSVLAGIGTAGVPGGSLPMIVIVLQSVGVPGEGIGIILGVDRVLDMCRTVINVTGDLAVAACVARGERP